MGQTNFQIRVQEDIFLRSKVIERPKVDTKMADSADRKSRTASELKIPIVVKRRSTSDRHDILNIYTFWNKYHTYSAGLI